MKNINAKILFNLGLCENVFKTIRLYLSTSAATQARPVGCNQSKNENALFRLDSAH